MNNSEYLTTIRGTEVYMGFVNLKGLEKQLIETIILQRSLHGPFDAPAGFHRTDPDRGRATEYPREDRRTPLHGKK